MENILNFKDEVKKIRQKSSLYVGTRPKKCLRMKAEKSPQDVNLNNILYIQDVLVSRARKTFHSIKYTDIAEPWEKATRMMYGFGYVDRY